MVLSTHAAGLDEGIMRKLKNMRYFKGPYYLLGRGQEEPVIRIHQNRTVGYAVIVKLVGPIHLQKPTGRRKIARYCCTGTLVDDQLTSEDIRNLLHTIFQPIIRMKF
jgi:hypothetical protein